MGILSEKVSILQEICLAPVVSGCEQRRAAKKYCDKDASGPSDGRAKSALIHSVNFGGIRMEPLSIDNAYALRIRPARRGENYL